MKEISTQEQIASVHEICKIENGFILITVEQLGYLASGQNYRIIETGDEIKVTGKKSGVGSGKKTIYIADVNNVPFEGSIEDLKELLKIDFRREKASNSNITTALGKLHNEVSKKVSELVEACSDELSEGEYTELKNAYLQLWGLAGTFRKAQREAEVKAKEEAEAAARAAKKSETAAKYIRNASDMVLAQEMANRMNITVEQALKMLGH